MGDYGVAIAYGGQPMEFVLSMVRDEQGKVGGSIYIDQFGTIAFNSVVVEGKHVTASLGSPDGSTVSMDFTVDAGELAGSWRSSNGDGSAIRGRKLK